MQKLIVSLLLFATTITLEASENHAIQPFHYAVVPYSPIPNNYPHNPIFFPVATPHYYPSPIFYGYPQPQVQPVMYTNNPHNPIVLAAIASNAFMPSTPVINTTRLNSQTHAQSTAFATNVDSLTTLSAALYKEKLDEKKNKIFTCNQCGYTTPRKFDIMKHIKIHTGEKSFACDQCFYTTIHSSNLKVHKRTHTKEKPFACDQCDFKTAHISCLNRHKARKHYGNTSSHND